jgi:hypothetical protein
MPPFAMLGPLGPGMGPIASIFQDAHSNIHILANIGYGTRVPTTSGCSDLVI